MTDVITIAALAKDKSGKGSAKRVRDNGRVPAVVYGNKKAPESISIDQKDLLRELAKKTLNSVVYDITVDGGKPQSVLIRDVQLHKLTGMPIHVDFLRVSKTAAVSMLVPVKLTNRQSCPGLKLGGSLGVNLRKIKLLGTVTNIPSEIVIDLSTYEAGNRLQVKDLELPKGVSAKLPDNFVILAINKGRVSAS